jgi:hypothetical protein
MANAKVVNTPSQAIPQNGAAHVQRTVSSTAVDVINHTLQGDTTHVLMQVLGATIRATFDGTNPTTVKGFEYVAGSSAYMTRLMASKMKAIRAGGTDAVIETQELNFL